jgi:hypothetical protein
VLHNPRYAGVFSFGRHRQILGPDQKTRTRPVTARHEQIAFIPNAHPGYITLAAFDANQARLAECAAAHGTDRKAGPPREGPALLQGIIICGRCGRRMTVRYHLNHDGAELPTYVCQHDKIQNAGPDCQSIPGAGIDTAIGALLIDTLTPLAVEAALTVTAELQHRAHQADQLRAAATSPSTPPTGSSPTPSKPTTTTPSAPTATPKTPTTKPPTPPPGPSPMRRKPASANWSPTSPPSSTTPTHPTANANAWPACSSPT